MHQDRRTNTDMETARALWDEAKWNVHLRGQMLPTRRQHSWTGAETLASKQASRSHYTCPVCGTELPSDPAKRVDIKGGIALGKLWWDVHETYVCSHCGGMSQVRDSYAVPLDED
jgi:predicted RNA-binding Zn-ribbon protein involved in translation (DUF1610 family)